jgi:hypothetical protein
MLRETSVAASMARSVTPGWGGDCGVSVFNAGSLNIQSTSGPAPLAIRACARFEQRVEKTFGYPRQAP